MGLLGKASEDIPRDEDPELEMDLPRAEQTGWGMGGGDGDEV